MILFWSFPNTEGIKLAWAVSNLYLLKLHFQYCNWKKCWIRLGRIFSHIFMPNMSFSPVSEDFFDWQKIWATWHAMAYHCQSDCQTSWFKDMSSVLIILCLFFYLAIIWQSQVKVYFSLDLILLLSDPIPYVARSKLTLHSAQLFRRGWCWYYSILEALRSKNEARVWRNFQWIICHPNKSILINCNSREVQLHKSPI